MVDRRALLRGSLFTMAGAATAFAGAEPVRHWLGWDRPPLGGGYASAADNLDAVAHGGVQIHYFRRTEEKLVALTFDDGPLPEYTPQFLDVLDEARVPATFFVVGRHLDEHAGLVRQRFGRHEVGNHSWSHDDLATLDLAGARRELERTHDAIKRHLGREATLMRPPYGHLGGSTVLAADSMGYDIALWSHQMRERRYAGDPTAQAQDLIDTVRPGAIVLAHDAGDKRRLVALNALPAMICALQEKGYRFVTVSELLADGPDQARGTRNPEIALSRTGFRT
ncbi:polysaccharide deacetylase family protein [Actinoplanes sp. TRM 88003]|uniref:Polysaccharide deacetylase family protein n=1 Tax=Paractinoplanes aksuensis TaxID=2939490 RepID=A0ABT1DTE1_9ACTN|nr:polysaccharide deacetylase family protein [Actinoplanes aksuensis]MCO8274080.1 polysaccharide deacetylase family protein [Actinoplanes aksuensis]